MRYVILAATAAFLSTAALLSIGPAHADKAKWCATYARSGAVECLYHTFQQCQESIAGMGGFCSLNYSGRRN
jgi:hypothetical protein